MRLIDYRAEPRSCGAFIGGRTLNDYRAGHRSLSDYRAVLKRRGVICRISLSLSLSYIQKTAGPKAFLMSRLPLLEYS